MYRKWIVFAIIVVGFFVLNASTFASLGVVLFVMADDLDWSYTSAGLSFTILGLAVGLTSFLPAVLLQRIGARLTFSLGFACVALGFGLASASQGLAIFFAAMCLVGAGFSMAGNVTAVWLIAEWFPQRSGRMIGLYLMLGGIGDILGPSLSHYLIEWTSWRFNWLLLAGLCGVLILIGGVFITDRKAEADGSTHAGDELLSEPSSEIGGSMPSWRQAIKRPLFLVIAAAITFNLACVTTVHSIAVSHLKLLGLSPAVGALGLSFMALVSLAFKGLAGPLCERFSSRHILALSMALQAVGVVLFSVATSPGLVLFSSLLFGAGWGITVVATMVLLVDCFGQVIGAQLLGAAHQISSIAAFGPLAAGMAADKIGSFAPVFFAFAIALGALAFIIQILRDPSMLTPSELRSRMV
jgi:MFS transporter, OFA family, oxalate/formate antiporter